MFRSLTTSDIVYDIHSSSSTSSIYLDSAVKSNSYSNITKNAIVNIENMITVKSNDFTSCSKK